MLIYSGIVGCLLLHSGFINSMDHGLRSLEPWQLSKYKRTSKKKDTGIPSLYKRSIKQLPPLLQHFCAANPKEYHAERLLESAHKMYCRANIDRRGILYHAKKICHEYHLSVQTTSAVLDACESIINKQPFNLTKSLLSYNPAQELAYKHDLINRMPTIMRDICITNPDGYHTWDLMRLLLNKEHDFADGIDYAITYNVGCLLYEKPKQIFISPHTSVRLNEEFRAVVHHNSIPPHHPYNREEELANNFSLVQHFPSPLIEYCSKTVGEFFSPGLIACAYMLWHPHTEILLKPYKTGNIEKSTAFYIEEIVGKKKPQLVSEFIKIFRTLSAPLETHVPPEKNEFSVIDSCFKELSGRILVSGTMHDEFITLLENRCAKLRSLLTHNKTLSEKYNNLDYVEGELCEELPSCPVCLELFTDYFRPKMGCDVGHECMLECRHSVCTTCLQRLEKNCPLCRKEMY
jgi:hypothetical protein